jgi:DNA repair ATPase RecN
MIEQILAFVLGAGSVFLIWGVVVAFRTSRGLKSVQEELPNIYERINEIDESLNHKIEAFHKDSIKHTDSRVDKLESTIKAKFNDIFSYDEKKSFEMAELRQRVNSIKELVDDITGLTIKK